MNTEKPLFYLALGAALGCGLMAGTFFAFSVFVMKGLGHLPAREGIAAMQSVNIAVLNPVFFAVFLGSVVLSLGAIIYAVLHLHSPSASYLLAGGVLYLVGCFGVTGLFNVPLNDALAAVRPDSAHGASVWANYLTVWTMWNHVRTVACLGAMGAFVLALYNSR